MIKIILKVVLKFTSIIRNLIFFTNFNGYIYKRINKYGPFKIHIYFLFSDFKRWGTNYTRVNVEHKKILNLYKTKNVSLFPLLIKTSSQFNSFIDIGAHIGLVSMPISNSMSSKSKIYSIEPSDINYKMLSYHVKKNKIKNISTYKILIGDRNLSKIKFYENKIPDGMNNLYNYTKKGKKLFENYKEMMTLDNFCKSYNLIPELVKIDVEGSEIDIFNGSKKLLENGNTIFFVSIHLNQLNYAKKNIDELKKLMSSYSYNFYDGEFNVQNEIKSQEYMILNKKTYNIMLDLNAKN